MGARDVWFEFMGPLKLCGLCGNRGIINTKNTVTSPIGTPCGVEGYCICPNGRAMKKTTGKSKWNSSSLL